MKIYFLCFVLYFALPVSVSGLSKFCSKPEECPASAICRNGLCICDAGKITSLNGEKCLDIVPGLGSSCEESSQCSALIAGTTICNSKQICSCDSGHVFLNNKCVKYQSFNETCNDDTKCFDGVDLFAMKCDDGRCGCSEGYYLRGEYDCRKSAKDDGKCLLDLDCEAEDQYCKFKYGPLGDCRVGPDIPCEDDKDCGELKNSFCAAFRQKKCTCNDDFLYDKDKNECVPEPKADELEKLEKNLMEINVNLREGIETACSNDEDCKEVRNSFCALFRNKCICNETFIYEKYSGHCVRGLGSDCLEIGVNSTEPECGVRQSSCNEDNNTCQCAKYFVYSPNSNKCFKPTRVFNEDSCGSDENCYTFGPYATCTKEQSTDVTTRCRCLPTSVYDEENKYCKPLEVGTGCKDDCKFKLHSKCELGQCVCEDNYIEENLKCFPDLGYPCSVADESDCIIDNAECVNLGVNNKCQCKNGYFQTDTRECLEVIDNLEENCVSDKQCFKFLDEGGICFNNTCTCNSTHVHDEKENKCELIRNIGDQCSSLKHCQTMLNSDHVRCLNGKCVCDYDYHLTDDESRCVADSGANIPSGRELIFFIVLLVTTLFFFW